MWRNGLRTKIQIQSKVTKNSHLRRTSEVKTDGTSETQPKGIGTKIVAYKDSLIYGLTNDQRVSHYLEDYFGKRANQPASYEDLKASLIYELTNDPQFSLFARLFWEERIVTCFLRRFEGRINWPKSIYSKHIRPKSHRPKSQIKTKES